MCHASRVENSRFSAGLAFCPCTLGQQSWSQETSVWQTPNVQTHSWAMGNIHATVGATGRMRSHRGHMGTARLLSHCFRRLAAQACVVSTSSSRSPTACAERLTAAGPHGQTCQNKESSTCLDSSQRVVRHVVFPSYFVQEMRHGVGYRRPSQQCQFLHQCLWHVFSQIRGSNVAPLDWHCSQGIEPDKNNGKESCQSVRLVNVLDPLGQSFYKNLWRQGAPRAARGYASGYAAHRSREEAILYQACLAHRLRAAKKGHCIFFKDVANAFYSPAHSDLDQAVDRAARVSDAALLKQRHRKAIISIQAQDRRVNLLSRQWGLASWHLCVQSVPGVLSSAHWWLGGIFAR